VTLRVADTNHGARGGADVIEGYVHDPAFTGEPPEQLRAFAKVWLDPGQTKVVSLQFHPGAFAYWNSGPATGTSPQTTSPTTPQATPSPQPAGHWTVAPGTYRIDIGRSSEQFNDSTQLRLEGWAAQSATSGLFGWALGGESGRVR
jgi:fibronectin type III domain protein